MLNFLFVFLFPRDGLHALYPLQFSFLLPTGLSLSLSLYLFADEIWIGVDLEWVEWYENDDCSSLHCQTEWSLLVFHSCINMPLKVTVFKYALLQSVKKKKRKMDKATGHKCLIAFLCLHCLHCLYVVFVLCVNTKYEPDNIRQGRSLSCLQLKESADSFVGSPIPITT